MPRKPYRRGCTGRVRFPSNESAEKAAAKLRAERGVRTYPYRCHWGDHFHIGHQWRGDKQAEENRRRRERDARS